MSFTLSSSSESEEDDDRPVTYVRSTEFIQQVCEGNYNAQFCPNWPNELHCQCYFPGHSHANQSSAPPPPLANGCGNSSMADVSHPMNGSRILDSSAILNTTPEEEFVLIKVGDKYQQVRVIPSNAVLPSASAPEQRPMHDQSQVNIKIESPPQNHQQATDIQIPLERIDFTTLPVDPRVNFTDYCYLSTDEDSFPWTLPLPRFWREILRQIEQNLNHERSMQGMPKRPTSFIRDRVLNSAQRMAVKPDPSKDPRRRAQRDPRISAKLEQSLFIQPPRKVQSPSQSHNQSVPNLKTSIFDAPDGEDESSDSSSSSSLSFSSCTENESTNKPSQPNGSTFLTDVSDDDEDLSFQAFKRRRTAPSMSVNKKISPIQNGMKNTRATRSRSSLLNGTKNLLLEKPPLINKDDILNSLTDPDDTDDDDFTPVVETLPDSQLHNGDENGTTSDIPIVTGTEAINILNSLADNVTDNMEINGENVTSIDAVGTAPIVNVPEPLIDNKGSENCASVVPIAEDFILTSLTDNEAVDMEIDGLGNCAPVVPDATSPNVSLVGVLNGDKSDSGKVHGDANRNPIAAVATTSKANGVKNSRAAVKKDVAVEKKGVSVEKKVIAKKVVAKKVVSKKIPTKDAKTKTTKTKEAEPKKPNTKDTEAKKATTVNTETEKITINDTEAENVETKQVAPKKTSPILKKVKRAKVVIVNMDFYEQIECITVPMDIPLNNNDSELSDEDFGDDVPCKMDEVTLPNSNTDRAVDKLKSTCNLCEYEAPKGWKQLTKHYVRKHPNCEIPISRLANDQNPMYLSKNPFTPEITESSTGLMIKSHCPICNEVYAMHSEKWLHHFVAHTGEYEYRCNVCQQQLSQDLHKKCNSMNNDRINTHAFVENVLYAYVCIQCKYIQLTKENLRKHLDRDHQQISVNDQNIVEINLLESSSKNYLMAAIDSKFEKTLVEAKKNHQPNQEDEGGDHDDIINTVDMPVDSDYEDNVVVDLTLSDEE